MNTQTTAAAQPRKADPGIHGILQWPLELFGSLGFCVILLMFLALLTFLGTLEQVEMGLFDVQKKYFESLYLVHDFGLVSIPLPGAGLVQLLLFFNILVGGILRLRKRTSASYAGIMVTHVGIAFLLFSGFWKLYFADEGHVTFYENETANFYESYYDWEIAASRELGDGKFQEFVIPQGDFAHATGPAKVTLFAPELPFDLEVNHFTRNGHPELIGSMGNPGVPVVDGVFMQKQEPFKETGANRAGLYVELVEKDGGARHQGLLWGFDVHHVNRMQATSWAVDVGDDTWHLELRHTRYPLPFTVTLDKFTKEEHARTTMASAFSSDVTVGEGGNDRGVKIEMNEPLRDEGLVVYQSGWGPSNAKPGDPLFSTLAVVRNRADQWPLYSCIVIAVGLLIHFSEKLFGYIGKEVSKA